MKTSVMYPLLLFMTVITMEAQPISRRAEKCPYAWLQQLADEEFRNAGKLQQPGAGRAIRKRPALRWHLFYHVRNPLRNPKKVREGRLSRCFVG
jgi:hypothetical protein